MAEENTPDNIDETIKNDAQTAKTKLDALRDKTKDVDYQVDSTMVGYRGAFRPSLNTISINHTLSEREQRSTLQHEAQHRINSRKGLYNYGLSEKQYYEICMADEISANMAQLIALRDEYIQTGDLEVFDCADGKFDFYKQAIIEGKIDPKSTKPEDFAKDMHMIAEGTHKMWMDNWANAYFPNHKACAAEYCRRARQAGKSCVNNESNYQECMKIAFTIGGINFNDYYDFTNNIEPPEIAKGGFVLDPQTGQSEYQDGLSDPISKKALLDDIQNCNNLVQELPYAGDMSLDEYRKILEHKCLRDYSILRSLAKDRHLSAEDEKFCLEEIRNNSNLTEFERVRIDEAVWYAYQTKGEHPSNPKNYQKQLNKVYTKDEQRTIQKYNLESYFTPSSKTAQDIIQEYESAFNNDGTYKDVTSVEKKPEYHEWTPENRVSGVQHAEILDMEKEVITKPNATNCSAVKMSAKDSVVTTCSTVESNSAAKGFDLSAVLRQQGLDYKHCMEMINRLFQSHMGLDDLLTQTESKPQFDLDAVLEGKLPEQLYDSKAQTLEQPRVAQSVNLIEIDREPQTDKAKPAIAIKSTEANSNKAKFNLLSKLRGTGEHTIAHHFYSSSRERDAGRC